MEIRDNLKSSAPISPTRTCTSTRSSTPVQPMQVNDDFNDKIYNKHDEKSHDERYLTVKQFNYSMNLLNVKISSIYKLLHHVSDQQQKDSQIIQKLVVVAYKEIGKDLIPSYIFLLDNKYRITLEKYLTEHAGHYIKEIGKNGWVSLFEDKLLPEIKKVRACGQQCILLKDHQVKEAYDTYCVLKIVLFARLKDYATSSTDLHSFCYESLIVMQVSLSVSFLITLSASSLPLTPECSLTFISFNSKCLLSTKISSCVL
ncbi:hypothetical protein C1646_769526 [Rhizophagus diaphanus]|nr:hypothetical protein C1646_769526 [Rhizophagus diaphanus] [Rhizophagus sp. MUCL 43196]